MDRLCTASEKYLKDLLENAERSGDIDEYVISHIDDVANKVEGADMDYMILEDLKAHGMLDFENSKNHLVISGITPKGLSYFEDLDRSKKLKRKEIWSNRRFQIALSLITLILSTFAGWVAGHI